MTDVIEHETMLEKMGFASLMPHERRALLMKFDILLFMRIYKRGMAHLSEEKKEKIVRIWDDKGIEDKQRATLQYIYGNVPGYAAMVGEEFRLLKGEMAKAGE